jgi:O-antigen ligase
MIFLYRQLLIGIAILGLSWSIKLFLGEVRFDRSLLSACLVLWVMMLFISWVIYNRHTQGWSKLGLFIGPIICFMMISSVPVSTERVRRFLSFFLALFIGKCFYQLIYYRIPHTIDHRLKYFGNPIVYGQLLAMVCILLLFLMRNEKILAKILGYIALLLISLSGLFFTYARGAWLGLIAGLFWFIGTNAKNRLVLKLVIFLVIFGLGALLVEPCLISRIDSIFSLTAITNVQRLVIWKASLQMFSSSPFFGVGLNMFPVYFQKISHNPLIPTANHAHNNLLNILVEFGLIGLGIWLLLIAAIIIKIRDIFRNHPDSFNRSLGQVIITWLITIFMHGLTDYTFAMIIPMTLFMVLLGLLVGMENTNTVRSTTAHLKISNLVQEQ